VLHVRAKSACVSVPTNTISILKSDGAYALFCTNDCLYGHETHRKLKFLTAYNPHRDISRMRANSARLVYTGWSKIYYLELLRASECTLSRWSRLYLQSLATNYTGPAWWVMSRSIKAFYSLICEPAGQQHGDQHPRVVDSPHCVYMPRLACEV
jgi:hypothetical protein